jgi:hypothetical protein
LHLGASADASIVVEFPATRAVMRGHVRMQLTQ